MELTRGDGEPLGMHIKGGTDNPGNPLRKNDAGIFISKILPSGAIYRCGMLKVGMQILSVNGQPLLNVTHNDAVNVLRGAGSEIEMMVSNGYDPNEVDRLREEGKLPEKIVEVLQNSEEAAAAEAKVQGNFQESGGSSPTPRLHYHHQDTLESNSNSKHGAKPSVDKVMEVVRAAEQLVGVPSSPTGFKDKGAKGPSAVGGVPSSASSTAVAVPPSSPGFDIRKTTVVMTGHSLTSPGLGGQKRFGEEETGFLEPKPRTHLNTNNPHDTATYANLNELNSFGGGGTYSSNGDVREDVFNDSDYGGGGALNGGGMEARNPLFNGNNSSNNSLLEIGLPPLPPGGGGGYRMKGVVPPSQLPLESEPPVPTPRTSIGSMSGGRLSPSPLEEVS